MPSLLEAIEAKYGYQTEAPIGIFVKIPKGRPSKSTLVLNDCDVSTAGDEDALENYFQTAGVLEIDLAHNRLTQWSEISKILQFTPSVTFLNLSFNTLPSPLTLTCTENSFRFPLLPRLTVLILINTNVSWDSVWFLLRQASNLQELHLSLNNFATVDLTGNNGRSGNDNGEGNRSGSSSDSGNESCSDDDNGQNSFPHIRKIMFDGNPIQSWAEVAKLGSSFPSVRHLALADCLISTIPEDAFQCFADLQSISMTNTLLRELTDLASLASFPALTEIRIQGIPLLGEMAPHERRQFLIAMLPNVKKLNGGAPISMEEREDAERAFVRRFAQQDKDITPPKRYYDLIDVHGALSPLVDVQLKPTTRVKLNVIVKNDIDGEIVKKLHINVYQTTSELKANLSNLLKIRASRMRLFYNSGVFGVEEMKFPQKKLYTYKMQDGDEIHVEQKV